MTTHTSIAELTAAYPDLVAEIRKDATTTAAATLNTAALAAARAEGAKAEHARVAGIEAAALPGHEALLAELKADGSITPEAAAMRFINAEKAVRTGHADAIKNVEGATGKIAAAPATPRDEPKGYPNTVDGWKAEFAASAELQEEFGSEGKYLTYREMTGKGRIRILSQRPAA